LNLFLFDFDGTLTKKDSMIEFLVFLYPKRYNFYVRSLKFIPYLFMFFFSFIDLGKCKNYFLYIHLKNFSREELETKSKLFSDFLLKHLYPKAKDYINTLSKEDDKYIVTASLDIWMINFAKKINFNLISTKSIFINGRFSNIDLNCNGETKVTLIKQNIMLEKYDKIFVFGNSKKDYPMMSLGTNSYFKHFG